MLTPLLKTAEQFLPGYVRREDEEVIAQALLHGRKQVIVIEGAPGVGKTTLAMMVARRLAEYFPGGVWGVTSTPIQSLSESAFSVLPAAPQAALLILNDVEHYSDSDIENELQRVLSARPKVKILITSRRTINAPSIGLWITLGNFTLAETREFLYKYSRGAVDPSLVDKLYDELQGNPLTAAVARDALQSGVFTPDELLESIAPFSREGLVGPDGHPLSPDSEPYETIVTDTTAVSDQLLEKLAQEPNLLYELSPRLFEEIVADLLGRLNYEVTLTPASRDGGKDIYAAKRNELGSFLYIVECKKYSPDNPVGVGLVRQLYGVVQAEKATAGILATTSYFTKGAKEFQSQVAYQISLQDYLGIQKWLKSI